MVKFNMMMNILNALKKMYNYSNEISKKLDEIEDVIIEDGHPTIDELMQIRKATSEGLCLCKKLYKKSGSAEKVIDLYYNRERTEYSGYDCIVNNLPGAT